MARFLLIHGASHGAWCWSRLIPHLEKAGHRAAAIDLPGHGADRTPRDKVSLSDYTDAILRAMLPGTLLVGHSFGGVPITLAATAAKPAPGALIYLAALLPQSGKAFAEFRREAISPKLDGTHLVDVNAGVSTPNPKKASPFYYSDCDDATRAFATARLTPQPISVMQEKVDFRMPDTPRHYIRCLLDAVVLPDYQQRVSENWAHTHDLKTGHSPFLSNPEDLAAVLDRIAKIEMAR